MQFAYGLICAAVIVIIFTKGVHIQMPQSVKISVTLNINPAPPPPLVVDKDTVSLPDEQVGVDPGAVSVAQVSGGTPPFSVALDPASPSPLPPGLSAAIDASGKVSISGIPEASGSGTFVLSVSDSGA